MIRYYGRRRSWDYHWSNAHVDYAKAFAHYTKNQQSPDAMGLRRWVIGQTLPHVADAILNPHTQEQLKQLCRSTGLTTYWGFALTLEAGVSVVLLEHHSNLGMVFDFTPILVPVQGKEVELPVELEAAPEHFKQCVDAVMRMLECKEYTSAMLHNLHRMAPTRHRALASLPEIRELIPSDFADLTGRSARPPVERKLFDLHPEILAECLFLLRSGHIKLHQR